MFPPQQSTSIDLAALSGICGSISIACWVVVFSPQIIENFRRSSAEGLSITFLIIWLAGDVFNILGAVLQGVLPTMTILAIYYTLADIVLIAQVFYYRGFSLSDSPTSNGNGTINHEEEAEARPLLHPDTSPPPPSRDEHHQRTSSVSQLHHYDATHLSPATPLHHPLSNDPPNATRNLKPRSNLQRITFNATAILLVCTAGAFGWWVSTYKIHHPRHGKKHHTEENLDYPEFDTWGQIFGYFCAVLYLGSRVPQILLNYKRKSTEGVSLLFFLFACIGNLTYDLSIFAYDPAPLCEGKGVGVCADGEAAAIYGRYIAVNASWIAGSLGTLLLDMCIFVQFFLYRMDEDDDYDSDAVAVDDER
jgi:solute carrier family 66 (lysosomal lysine-arginine transporter), member 1